MEIRSIEKYWTDDININAFIRNVYYKERYNLVYGLYKKFF